MMETSNEGQEASLRGHFNMFDNEKYENMFIRSISNELDEFFEGGLHKGTATQVYGESGCGKSQLAMLFAIGVTHLLVRPSQEAYPVASYRLKSS
jgi:RecA/RadA recombinase